MNVDRAVLAFAGVMILLSLILARFFSPYWLLFTAFIGLNMLQSAFTGFCPPAIASVRWASFRTCFRIAEAQSELRRSGSRSSASAIGLLAGDGVEQVARPIAVDEQLRVAKLVREVGATLAALANDYTGLKLSFADRAGECAKRDVVRDALSSRF